MIRTEKYFLEVTPDVLDFDQLYSFVLSEDCGAVTAFVGTVRNNFDGRAVTGMEYYGYAEMAEAQLERIVKQVFERWQVGRVAVQHRLGELTLTESSVIILVSSAHRAEAHEGSRFIIEEIKKDLPVWKKEHFSDGESKWKYME